MREPGVSLFETFSAVRGQDRAVAQLGNELSSQRIHHAHLFIGPEGVGKSTVALAWASRLLCPRATGIDACGSCPSCLKLKKGSHPDLMQVGPDGNTIKIEQVRAISSATRYQPNEGRWRVIIIERAETMGEAAANALLKTLEEPGGSSLFVLLSAHANLLLPTTRSRCIAVPFGALSFEATETVLAQRGIEETMIPTLARLSRGSPGRAVELANSSVLDERSDVIRAFVRVARGDVFAGLELAEWAANGNDRALLGERILIWMGILRDVTVLSSTQRPDLVHNQDEQRGIEALSQALSPSRVSAWIEEIGRARGRLRGNVNLRLIMESLVLEFSED